jgi:short-subunit dehydrogenase
MRTRHKPLHEQVMVVTGASSGIGLTTAQMAAERGAQVVLVARSEEKLREVTEGLRAKGHRALHVVADVSDAAQVEQVVRTTEAHFGGIDTWVNNASAAIYGRLEDVPLEDARRLFDVDYFGMVNGCRAALPSLRKRGGGALINVGSVVSDRALPLIGHYSAAKHAVKAFSDALRMELEKAGEAISVTLIKPGSINTPFTQHSENLMEQEPDYPPPVYQPEVVARAILSCAERPRRDVLVGGGAKMISLMGHFGRLADVYMEKTMFSQQKKDRRGHRGEGSLRHASGGELPSRHGDHPGHVMRSSLYTQARLHPLATSVAAAAVGAGVLYALRRR